MSTGSPLNTTIGQLVGTCTLTYEVSLTRDDAIEYLVDAGEDGDKMADLSDRDLLDRVLDTDECRWRLDDVAAEVDSTSTAWEVR